MQIHITDEAVNWFIEEMDLEAGANVRFYPKYGGNSVFQDGFTVGMSLEEAQHRETETVKKDIHFQIDQKDAWFFDGHDLYIDVKQDEVVYNNEPS